MSQVLPVIIIDWDLDEPVYGQIARQIRSCILSGKLLPGTILPGVRSVASDLGVNLNTAARAYRALEGERFIVIRDRSGATVAPPPEQVDDVFLDRLSGDLQVLMARMRQAGLTSDELRARIERMLSGLETGNPVH